MLEDKLSTALITGSARRIGAEVATHLHRNGYNVVIHCNHSLEQGAALTESLNMKRENSAVCVSSDLQENKAIEQLVKKALDAWGGLDCLVNNASAFFPTPFGTITESNWDELFASNLKAPFFLSQLLAEPLAQRRGSIVNIADIHGLSPLKDYSVYSIAKAGNVMLTKSLAKELAPNVRVNSVAPGAMLWPEDAEGNAIKNTEKLAAIPLGRLGGAKSIAEAVLFLAGADYITGEILCVAGGAHL